ncbi:MAG TPA: D-alanyl-D-alanine carboxypeptidase family protein [Solirubrobacteraceae bacterium]|nr:D-alanyl-D-alanine carboxypeptidase family protein [Solirubrobacteraceae bacterium]
MRFLRGLLGAVATALAVTALGATAGQAAAAPPSIGAPAAILVEPQTQDIVFARHANQRRAIASTTKLMTALLTLENAKLSDVYTAAPYSPSPGESLMGLRTGERITVADLLRGLLIVSANDAANTLAVDVAGSRRRFVAMMNQRARQLGLRDTHYANPVGLDQPGNYSSAADLVKLTLVLRQRAFFRQTTDLGTATLRSGARVRHLVNRNDLVREVPVVNGVKTGHTNDAGYVLVGSATRRGVTVISVVLGDSSEATRDSDSLRLLRYGLARYRRVTALRRGAVLARAALKFRDEHVDLVAARSVLRVARQGDRVATRVVGAPSEIEGPLDAGTRVGTVEVRQRGRVVARVALVTARAVSAPTLGQRVSDYLERGSTRAVLVLLALCSLYLALFRRRSARRRNGAEGHGLAS